ncbi:hypothetical protein BD413DRAFT_648590, partial [Trametes elegans]
RLYTPPTLTHLVSPSSAEGRAASLSCSHSQSAASPPHSTSASRTVTRVRTWAGCSTSSGTAASARSARTASKTPSRRPRAATLRRPRSAARTASPSSTVQAETPPTTTSSRPAPRSTAASSARSSSTPCPRARSSGATRSSRSARSAAASTSSRSRTAPSSSRTSSSAPTVPTRASARCSLPPRPSTTASPARRSPSPPPSPLPENADIVQGMGVGSCYAAEDSKVLCFQRNGDGRIRTYAWHRVPLDWELPGAPAEAKEALLGLFSDWAPWMRKFIRIADEGAIYPRPLFHLPVGHGWAHARGITLIGDAAHLMSLFAVSQK